MCTCMDIDIYIYIYPKRSKAANPPPRQNEKYERSRIAHGVLNIVSPKVFQKSSKMSPKSFQNRRLGRVLGALGASWGGPGVSWGVFGCLGGVIGRLVAVLGASWGVLARKRWPTWLQLGPQNEPRITKKSMPKSIKILMALGVGFLKDFGGFGKAKWSQVGIRIASQIDRNFERRFFEKTLFFVWKNNDFERSGAQSWEQKSIKNRSKNEVMMARHLGIDFHGF